MKTKSKRGDGGVTLVIILAVAAIAFMAPKPKFLDGRSREADKSADVSKQVEKAVADATQGEVKKAAVVSASVQKMGEAAAEAGDTPWAIFVKREADHISPLLPPPDYKALYAAEARKRAVLEGKVELADKLYAAGAKENQKLINENAELRAKVSVSFAERRYMDAKLQESAAYQRGQQQVIGVLIGISLLALAGWIYTKFTTLPKIDIARMANRAREAGGAALDVIDAVVPDSWHEGIEETAAKLRAKAEAKKAARAAAAKAAAGS